MERVTIACVVEGHGEVSALPKVVYRIARQLSVWNLSVPTPFRIPRGSLIAPGGIERAVAADARRVGAAGGVLVLLDADDDCPAVLGPSLLRYRQHGTGLTPHITGRPWRHPVPRAAGDQGEWSIPQPKPHDHR